ncbi:STAS domain-containing protein [Azospirillum sp. ST 5-10]|uniref:STAS domain-containing protein n=1 Tax=unclassified Azospirillum TaxID=2630922 RepID=UPI003F4A6954
MAEIRWSEAEGRVTLGLPGDLDLAMAQPLLDGLRAGFAKAGTVVVQAEAVERLSTACLQALLAASRHAADRGCRFAVERPSPVLVGACEDLGLAPWLQQWSVA